MTDAETALTRHLAQWERASVSRRRTPSLVVDAVVEVGFDEDGFGLWPITAAPRLHHLPLNGGLTDAEIGSVVQSALHWFYRDEDDRFATTVESYLDQMDLITEVEGITPMLFGGLRFIEPATWVTVLPGCCVSVDERSEVHDVLAGSAAGAWLGHDPDTRIIIEADKVVIDQLVDDIVTAKIVCSPETIRKELGATEQAVSDFLSTLATWAERHVSENKSRLVSAVSQGICPSAGESA